MDIYRITINCSSCQQDTVTIISPSVASKDCEHCGSRIFRLTKFSGVIYVMSNPAIDGVKIGRTEQPVGMRVRQLSTTGVPERYKVDAIFPSRDSVGDEKRVHKKLRKFNSSREHYNLSPAEAIAKVRSALSGCDPIEVHPDVWRKYNKILARNREMMQHLQSD